MEILIATEEHIEDLAPLVDEYFTEVNPQDKVGGIEEAKAMLRNMLKSNVYIYILVDKTEIIGYVTLYVDNQHGMVEKYLVVDYMYIKPSRRSSKATAMLFATTGHVSLSLGLDIVASTLSGSSNIDNASLIGAEEVATYHRYHRGVFKDRYQRYIDRYFKKGS